MINLTKVPLHSFTHQNKVSGRGLFANNGDCEHIVVHVNYARPFGDTDKLAVVFRLPVNLLAVVPEGILNVLPPQFTLFLKGNLLFATAFVALQLQTLDAGVIKRLCANFCEHVLVVDLYKHSLTHAYI